MWETFRNRGPERLQTEGKQAGIQKQIQRMLAAGITKYHLLHSTHKYTLHLNWVVFDFVSTSVN
jgi:hypothetical protein